MLVCFFLLLEVIKAHVTLSSNENDTVTSQPSHGFLVENVTNLCHLRPLYEFSYLTPWQEISQQAQGCSVPFYGPQGHGQHPEEVHIVHLTDVARLIASLSNQHHAAAAVTVWLDSASCNKKTTRVQVNESKSWNLSSRPFNTDKQQVPVLKSKLPAILESKDFASDYRTQAQVKSNSEEKTSYHSSSSHLVLSDFNSRAKRPLILLLTSDQPVTWYIKPGICWSENIASRIQVEVEKESAVESDTAVEVLHKTWVKRINRKNIQRYARRTFHGVASFTQVYGANSVRIFVGPGSPSEQEMRHQLSSHNHNKLNFCNFSSRDDSHLVSASLTIPLSAETCSVGTKNLTKCFIVDVQPDSMSSSILSGKGAWDALKNSYYKKTSNLTSIAVHLTENNSTSEALKNKSFSFADGDLSNITVILRSQNPSNWVLFSSVHQRTINIVASEEDVIDLISDSGGSLKFSSVPFNSSIFKVQTANDTLENVSACSSVHYFLIKHVTGFTLNIDSPIHQNEVVEHFHQKPRSSGIRFPNKSIQVESSDRSFNFSATEEENDLFSLLQSNVHVICRKLLLEIVLPTSVVTQLGVNSFHLKDKSCVSQSNGSHLFLTSQLKGCGSEVHTNGKSSVISNQVYFEVTTQNLSATQDERVIILKDGLQSSVKKRGVPVACSVRKPPLNDDVVRSIFNSRSEVAPEEKEDDGNVPSRFSSSSSIYQLEMYRHNVPSGSSTLIEHKSTVDINESVVVRAWMDDAPLAQAVIESCWISSLPNSPDWLRSQRIVLLQQMCPVEEGVRLEEQSSIFFPSPAKSFVFSFKILKDFLFLGPELYIHCQVGVCISSPQHLRSKPLLCVNPQDYCFHQKPYGQLQNLVSTAHQLITRGPILVAYPDSTSANNYKPFETKCTDMSVFPYSSTVSVDMTVAIAVCSFIIGVGLTAMLWFIHNKTEPSHRLRQVREHSLGSRSIVMGSSLSPHSGFSSTNSQSAIA